MKTSHRAFAVGSVLALAIAFGATSDAFAKGGRGGGHGASMGGGHGWAGSTPPGYGQGRKIGWDGGSYPPGFSKGKKKGWKGGSVPPGWTRY